MWWVVGQGGVVRQDVIRVQVPGGLQRTRHGGHRRGYLADTASARVGTPLRYLRKTRPLDLRVSKARQGRASDVEW